MKIIDSPEKYKSFENSRDRMVEVVFKNLRLDPYKFARLLTAKGGEFNNVVLSGCQIGMSDTNAFTVNLRAGIIGTIDIKNCVFSNVKVDFISMEPGSTTNVKISNCRFDNGLLIGKDISHVSIIDSRIDHISIYCVLRNTFHIINSEIKGFIMFVRNTPQVLTGNSLNFISSRIPLIDFVNPSTTINRVSKNSPLLNSLKSCKKVCMYTPTFSACDLSDFDAENWEISDSILIYTSNVENFNLMRSELLSSDYGYFTLNIYDDCAGKESMKFPFKDEAEKEHNHSVTDRSDTYTRYIIPVK